MVHICRFFLSFVCAVLLLYRFCANARLRYTQLRRVSVVVPYKDAVTACVCVCVIEIEENEDIVINQSKKQKQQRQRVHVDTHVCVFVCIYMG